MHHSTPLVTVIIPTFNRASTISRAIDSVIDQNFNDWELVIVDDHSTDDTLELLRQYSLADKRIKFLGNKNSKGPAGARNTGMEIAQGKYIAFLDSDDLWYPNHLEESINALETENAHVAWGLWHEYSGGEKKEKFNGQFFLDITVNELQPERKDNYYVFNHHLVEYLLIRRYYLLKTSTFVFLRKSLERTGLFDERLHGAEDIDLFFRLMINAKTCLVDNFHALYIQGDDNLFYFKDKYDFKNPKIAEKHKYHKSFEIIHFKKIAGIIENETAFMFKNLMLRSVYLNLSDKYSFLRKVAESLGIPEDIALCDEQMAFYKGKCDAIPVDGKKYFHLAYTSRFPKEMGLCLFLHQLNSQSLADANYWLVAEDYVFSIKTESGFLLYDLTSSEKLEINEERLCDGLARNQFCLDVQNLDNKNLIMLIQMALDKKLLRILRVEDKNTTYAFVSNNNLLINGSLSRGYKRDPELKQLLSSYNYL